MAGTERSPEIESIRYYINSIRPERPELREARLVLLAAVNSYFNQHLGPDDSGYKVPLDPQEIASNPYWKTFLSGEEQIIEAAVDIRKANHPEPQPRRGLKRILPVIPNPRVKIGLQLKVPNGLYEIMIYPERPNTDVETDIHRTFIINRRLATEYDFGKFQQLLQSVQN